ncbi:DNA-deoxyinosine glycosylase [Paenibacillus filicis]|uniref:DNA-deoxyinosine glycosylase n=1 Tax=Paenibacillus gyeongsangnamensis TaxID=3388067 RepID=A0ABT4QCA6_9BACL|nr:DNA-deoxyinosine glycosylase [Paenibacillus filicis]MCZ8514527.1 DNA-deoxyinosine glycosylase [Paenibacillus filicis]
MEEEPSIVTGLPPVVFSGARLLILGSMPGEASLQMRQYYGNPRNHFWRLMYALLDGGGVPDADYEARLWFLRSRGVALWDVLQTCERQGSLDSAIRRPRANDFAALFGAYPGIRHVFFNGNAAADLFRRHAAAAAAMHAASYAQLPSSSPARAMAFEAKLAAWQPLREAWKEGGA